MLAIIDYGMGNIGSVKNACQYLGQQVIISGDPQEVVGADHVILPGVGAFHQAMTQLRRIGMDEALRQLVRQQTPLLGICLGMQLLFEESLEDGVHQGLGLFPGRVERFAAGGIKVPHMGWNTVQSQTCRLFEGLQSGFAVYFVHSYRMPLLDGKADYIAGVTRYGGPFCSAVERGQVMATQFHPEKSGNTGLAILRNFLRASSSQ